MYISATLRSIFKILSTNSIFWETKNVNKIFATIYFCLQFAEIQYGCRKNRGGGKK
jgi:hypothetical protein